MDPITSVAGLAVAVVVIVEALKRSIKWVAGREDLVALVTGMVIGLGMWLTGEAFQDSGPIGLALQIGVAVIGAGLAHDKASGVIEGITK